ncbi:transcriptional regulator [Subtercola lobariae]|uniref:Transcriptional regulator n=2 Tax=Subtercola lobariae TaxID=1588641 RepID=A0A917B1Z8_9MICO|nr:transcriptional regulator [Subtercola lobariae]
MTPAETSATTPTAMLAESPATTPTETLAETSAEVSAPTSRRGGRPANGEPVLDRAFRLLDAFHDDAPRLTLTELSERTGIPLSSTLRLALHLSRLGALERQADGTFMIGLRLLEYASLAPRGHGLRSIALPYLEDLHRATGQHVQLAVRENDEGVIVERLSTPGAGKVLYSVGGRVPLHGTGLGLVLLAYSRPEFQDAYLQRSLFLEPEHTPVTAAEVRAQLQAVRQTGIAHMSRLLPEPAASVCAPIFDRSGACAASIAVLGADGTLDSRVVEPAVIAIARAITRDLKLSGR